MLVLSLDEVVNLRPVPLVLPDRLILRWCSPLMSPDIASNRWGASIDLTWPPHVIVYFLDEIIIPVDDTGF